ncbi:MAG: cytochrome c maturation protein CcmE [Firmicutes bacterium]|nr:cytochrome c maturation protein CcmE [Bacillota bacterium]
MDPRRRKVAFALMLVGIVLVYLIATAASNTTMYYLTVEEALARQDELVGRWVRVAGQVPGDSREFDPRGFRLAFDVEQDGKRIPAVYRGVRPDNLVDGAGVVLEGSFNEDGAFEVDRLLVQCASKYEAADRYDSEDSRAYEEIDGVLYESYESGWRGGR